jgi:RNA polymerase sigma-70 factor (ECF subfamily)
MNGARSFESLVLPHLDAAYNLARWMVRDEAAARDVVQDAFLRALRYFDSMQGDQARPWVLGIVRNCCLSWLEAQQQRPEMLELDEQFLDTVAAPDAARSASPPEMLEARQQRLQVDAAIAALAPPLREVIVLREIEGLAYAEIAAIADIPMGTVMSRLSRARAELKAALAEFRKHD